jgi:phosphoglycolate phosphatase
MKNLEKNQAAFLKLKKPKAVIFDWDNTLVNTWPLIHEAINVTMSEMGKPSWSLEKVRGTIHKSMREYFPELFGSNWQKAGEIYKNSYRSININQIQFLPNSLSFINKLEELNILQFVVSNKIGVTLRKEAEKLEVDKKFFSVIGSQDSNSDKPSKAPVELALMGCDLELGKDEIWFIGDTIGDIECAYNSECTPILYGCDEEQILKTIPHDILQNGKKGEGPLPIYFNHQQAIDLISS